MSAKVVAPSTDLFTLIHEIHITVNKSIDTSLTWEQLNSPPINYTVVRPIVERYSPHGNEHTPVSTSEANIDTRKWTPPNTADGFKGKSKEEPAVSLGVILYALMANRIQYINLAASDLSYAPLQTSRAAFCELLAMKILRTFPHPEDEANLVGELVRGYCAFEGAPDDVWRSIGDDRKEVESTRSSALELAIVSTSKHFLSLPLIQHLINEIYLGNLIPTTISTHSIISDSYISERTKARRRGSHNSSYRSNSPGNNDDRLREVYVYNPFEAGWLDHGRLRVPKWRKWLDFASFTVLLGLYIATLSTKRLEHVQWIEVVYIVFTLGFMLEEFAASKEHGWTVYSANAWNAFDMAYIAVFLLYLALRIFALATKSTRTSDLAFDILACGACILFPRLVFFLIKDNVVILALRAMIARFVGFMGLVIVAFSGICFCLWTLGRGTWTVRQIIWLMLQIWFGSSYLGFSASESFHPIFGPVILISYAALCNTLLITILISILSNQFAEINANAQEEHLFQRVVSTVEGVKSDALFSYLPPVNLFAVISLVPLSRICSPRTLHRINVFAIRLTSFPILIIISGWERYQYHLKRKGIALKGGSGSSKIDHIQRISLFDTFLGGGSESLISSVFELGPPSPTIKKLPLKPTEVPAQSTQPPLQSPDLPSSTDKGLQSPLAKLYGKTSSTSRDNKADKGGGKGRGVESREVEGLKEEIREMRESQLRMEEMLTKVLAGGRGE